MALRVLGLVAALGLTLAPRSALADCPDGWFCDEAKPAPPSDDPRVEPEEEPADEPEEEPAEPPRRRHRGHIMVAPPGGYPPPPPPRRRTELAVNIHLDAGIMGAGAQDDSFLGGAGFAFRVRPFPAFAVDLGLELVGGTDYNGNDRTEEAFVASALVFFNPRDRVQAFALGGLSLGGAGVRIRRQAGYTVTNPRDEGYTYLGAQIGVGVEWRVTRRSAITTDFSLFARGRTDSGRSAYPEYVDPSTHLVTNDSGGGLFRLGGTFYF